MHILHPNNVYSTVFVDSVTQIYSELFDYRQRACSESIHFCVRNYAQGWYKAEFKMLLCNLDNQYTLQEYLYEYTIMWRSDVEYNNKNKNKNIYCQIQGPQWANKDT